MMEDIRLEILHLQRRKKRGDLFDFENKVKKPLNKMRSVIKEKQHSDC
jgi:hypothetical protein